MEANKRQGRAGETDDEQHDRRHEKRNARREREHDATPLRHEERDEARTGQASRGDSRTGYGMNAQGAGGAIRMSPHNVIVNCKD